MFFRDALCLHIRKIIELKGLDEKAVAKIVSAASKREVSALMNGECSALNTDRLLHFLGMLGWKIEANIRPLQGDEALQSLSAGGLLGDENPEDL